jgi:hypothetical protein
MPMSNLESGDSFLGWALVVQIVNARFKDSRASEVAGL